jgi:hypothetical protein
VVGQQEVATITRLKILDMRQAMMNRQLSVAHQYGVMMCLKSFLKFCRTALALSRIDPSELTLPKRKAPQVGFLDNLEISKCSMPSTRAQSLVCSSGLCRWIAITVVAVPSSPLEYWN